MINVCLSWLVWYPPRELWCGADRYPHLFLSVWWWYLACQKFKHHQFLRWARRARTRSLFIIPLSNRKKSLVSRSVLARVPSQRNGDEGATHSTSQPFLTQLSSRKRLILMKFFHRFFMLLCYDSTLVLACLRTPYLVSLLRWYFPDGSTCSELIGFACSVRACLPYIQRTRSTPPCINYP